MSFSQPTYTVNEDDGSVQSILSFSNPSSSDITILVEDTNNTATGRLMTHYETTSICRILVASMPRHLVIYFDLVVKSDG